VDIPAEQARDLFAAARVARLATADAAGRPHLVPVTFAVEVAVDEQRVYFAVDAKPKRAAYLRRLRNIAQNPQVSLLVDEYAEDWRGLWWVRVDGVARVLGQDEGTIVSRAAALLRAKYPQYASSQVAMPGPFVEIEVTDWSGWRFAAQGADPGSLP
jgi:PPOX class probable F420-dependent enzyme